METGPDISLLRKIKVGQLEPALAREIIEFAESVGYETTITAKTSLGFILRIYQAEKAREKGREETLRKAEDLIMRLSSLHHEVQMKENMRRRESSRKRMPSLMAEERIEVGRKARELLGSIGITDEGIMEKAVALHGENGVESRVETVHSSSIGESLARKIFGEHPELILVPKESDFTSEIENIELKMEVIDNWKASGGKELPVWADYEKSPGILIDSYEDINRQLGIVAEERAEEPKEGKRSKYVPRSMKSREMWDTLARLGYEFRRKTKELVFQHTDGMTLTISDPHDREYDPITVRRIIKDLGVTPDMFEEARKRAKGVA